MYKQIFDNGFPSIEPVGVLCPEQGAALLEGESRIIYNSETYALGVSNAWDPNGSELFNTNLEPFVGGVWGPRAQVVGLGSRTVILVARACCSATTYLVI
ncbi:hypothetical protein N657DRAFT_643602, partial [Parathielavia appendiculata]